MSSFVKDGINPAYFYGPLYSIYHSIEQTWAPENIEGIQLVICQEETEIRKEATCHFDYITRNGEIIPNSATDIDFTFILKSQNISC